MEQQYKDETLQVVSTQISNTSVCLPLLNCAGILTWFQFGMSSDWNCSLPLPKLLFGYANPTISN